MSIHVLILAILWGHIPCVDSSIRASSAGPLNRVLSPFRDQRKKKNIYNRAPTYIPPLKEHPKPPIPGVRRGSPYSLSPPPCQLSCSRVRALHWTAPLRTAGRPCASPPARSPPPLPPHPRGLAPRRRSQGRRCLRSSQRRASLCAPPVRLASCPPSPTPPLGNCPPPSRPLSAAAPEGKPLNNI